MADTIQVQRRQQERNQSILMACDDVILPHLDLKEIRRSNMLKRQAFLQQDRRKSGGDSLDEFGSVHRHEGPQVWSSGRLERFARHAKGRAPIVPNRNSSKVSLPSRQELASLDDFASHDWDPSDNMPSSFEFSFTFDDLQPRPPEPMLFPYHIESGVGFATFNRSTFKSIGSTRRSTFTSKRSRSCEHIMWGRNI